MGQAATWGPSGARGAGRALAVVFAVVALLLQANAPVQAAMMAAGSDLPGNLCTSHSSGQDHRSPADRDAACAACAVCVAGATTAILSTAAALPLLAFATFHAAASRVEAPLRAHPVRAPNARAPPS